MKSQVTVKSLNEGSSTPMSCAVRFLKAFNELDHYIEKTLGKERHTSHAAKLDEFAKQNFLVLSRITELKKLASLRNAIVHWQGHVDEEPIAEPHEAIVGQYELLVQKVLNPPTAVDVATKGDDIYKVLLDSHATEVIREMNREVYTHVPVMDDNGRLVGVFSENTVFSYLADHEVTTINSATQIGEFINFIRLGSHRSEVFDFITPDTLLTEIEHKFRENLDKKTRLGALFVTASGNKEEKILGLITAWDVAGSNLKF